MEKQRLHIIRRKKHIILYDVGSMELYLVDNVSEENLQSLKRRKNTPITSLDDTIGNSKSMMNIIDERNRMHRITVCVSNDCNLRCKYCYAKGGNYGKKRIFMNEKTAENFVDFCTTNFNRIDNILFLGGEPLLNYPVIEYICELFKQQSLNKSFATPSFSVITNGTLCNDRIVTLIRDNISFITVSIDGNRSINDKNRVFKNGEGSFDRIAYFISRCKESTSAKLQFEATYTSEHINSGISRSDVHSFLNTKFEIEGIVVDEDGLNKKMIYEYLCNLTNDDLLKSDFECLPIDFWQVASTIIKKYSHRFCGIFDDRITITADGDIVGCQMLIGSDKNIISDIYDPDAIRKIKNQAKDFKNNPSCDECWCSALCGGCVIQKFYSKSERQLKIIPDYESCLLTRLYIEEILYLIFRIRADKALWPLFIEKTSIKFNS